MILLNTIMGSYLNACWTDVAKITGLWGGTFVLILPIVSQIVDAITNIIMGQIICGERSRSGMMQQPIGVGQMHLGQL